ncbi:repeat-containing protein [Rhodopirellula maiorica SM1]|uniref:Repeat-containing protein n=1 Tax=Rhodopirellula maiorica SM1 TaxID=1265738 RepID=M5S0U0_9BACT|nr:tetratricopeptide repeat protein [Rhodopirellula maiorica]EMI21267.1 repeat-containing protein [Rhodopirellula maiorica SM1]
MSNSDVADHQYYNEAVSALNNKDYANASSLCENAGISLERRGCFYDASIAFDLLGLVHYQSGALEDAKSAYLKSIELVGQTDEASGLEYAKTCNSLAAVINAMGDHALAKEWLCKSLQIKENAQDKPGLFSSYHQMGIIEQSRSDLNEARRWYSKAIALHQSEGGVDIAGLISTVRYLASTFGNDSDPRAIDDIYRIATDAMQENGDVLIAQAAAEQAREDYDYRAATEFYRKAYEMVASGNAPNKVSQHETIIKRIKRLW